MREGTCGGVSSPGSVPVVTFPASRTPEGSDIPTATEHRRYPASRSGVTPCVSVPLVSGTPPWVSALPRRDPRSHWRPVTRSSPQVSVLRRRQGACLFPPRARQTAPGRGMHDTPGSLGPSASGDAPSPLHSPSVPTTCLLDTPAQTPVFVARPNICLLCSLRRIGMPAEPPAPLDSPSPSPRSTVDCPPQWAPRSRVRSSSV